MGKEVQGEEESSHQTKQVQSTEELRRMAKDALEKANQLLAESGKLKGSEKPSEGDTKK